MLSRLAASPSASVAFWSLSAFEQLQGPHHQRHIRRLSGVWSGTTLRGASVQLSKPSDATYSARPVGQPGCGGRLPQPGQLTIGEELLAITTTTTTTISLMSAIKLRRRAHFDNLIDSLSADNHSHRGLM